MAARLRGKPAMAKSYGDDLRRKLLQAHDRGEGSLEQLAQRFSVSAPWAWKISAQRKRSGQMERVEQRRGTVRKVTAAVEQQLREWVQAQPDMTLAELQHKLVKAQHLQVSIGRLWQVLRQMGLRLKKSHSTPANAIPKPTSSGARPSSRRSAGSRRSG
jgi:transposase